METRIIYDRAGIAQGIILPDGGRNASWNVMETLCLFCKSQIAAYRLSFTSILQLLATLLLVASIVRADQKLLPAGSLVQCRTDEEKISSKTVDIGDPVICQITRSTTFPYGSTLTGQFSDFKDPGRFVGKGFMELDFDRVIIGHKTVIPISAKVVNVKGYKIDNQGRILGKGHATRDIVEWMIPLLWPLDLINLPRRGPRPTLKSETHLIVKLMEDVILDVPQLVAPRNLYGFSERSYEQDPAPTSEMIAPEPPAPSQYSSYPPPAAQNSTEVMVYSDGRPVGSGYAGGQSEYESVTRRYIEMHRVNRSGRPSPGRSYPSQGWSHRGPVQNRAGQVRGFGVYRSGRR